MKAAECLIYTDVDGVYTTDPAWCRGQRRLHTVSFEEMLEMAPWAPRCCRSARWSLPANIKVPLRVLSSFTPGTSTSTRKPSGT